MERELFYSGRIEEMETPLIDLSTGVENIIAPPQSNAVPWHSTPGEFRYSQPTGYEHLSTKPLYTCNEGTYLSPVGLNLNPFNQPDSNSPGPGNFVNVLTPLPPQNPTWQTPSHRDQQLPTRPQPTVGSFEGNLPTSLNPNGYELPPSGPTSNNLTNPFLVSNLPSTRATNPFLVSNFPSTRVTNPFLDHKLNPQVNNSAVNDPSVNLSVGPTQPFNFTGALKPKDIEMLKLEDLGQLHTKSLRNVFFQAVRSLGKSEAESLQVAMNRMDIKLRVFVGSRVNQIPNPTLAWLEKLLTDEFPGPLSLADAIRDMHTLEYDITENPRSFANLFKTKYETLKVSFSSEGCPSRATMLKQVMLKRLPTELRQRLELFQTEGYSEELFLTELEREKASYSLRVSAISNASQGNPNISQPPQNPTKESTSLPQFQTPRSNYQRPSRPCSYCQNGTSHPLRYCPRQPQYKSCFDCLSTSHWKGDGNCPYQTRNPSPPNQGPRSSPNPNQGQNSNTPSSR